MGTGTLPPVARRSRRRPRSAPARHRCDTRAVGRGHAGSGRTRNARRARPCAATRRRARALSSPCPGSSSRWSTTSTRGHERGGGVATGAPIATTASTVGAGVSTRTAAPHVRGAFERDVTRVPRRRALVLQRLVTLVEHDDQREIGHRCPHRAAAADHHARARTCARPVRGPHRVGVLRAERHHLAPFRLAICATCVAARVGRRIDHQRRPLRRQRHLAPRRAATTSVESDRPTSDAPGYTAVSSSSRSGDADQVRATTRHAGSWRRVRPSATRPTGTGRPRRQAVPPTRPPAPRAGRWPRAWRRRRRPPSRARVARASGTRTIVPTRHGARRRQRFREQVVEPAVDRGDVGLDPKNSQARDSAAFFNASA